MAYRDRELAVKIEGAVFERHADGLPILPSSDEGLGKRLNASIVRDSGLATSLGPLAQAALIKKGFTLATDANGRTGLHPSTHKKRVFVADRRPANTSPGYDLAGLIRASDLRAQPDGLDGGPGWGGDGNSYMSGTGTGYGLAGLIRASDLRAQPDGLDGGPGRGGMVGSSSTSGGSGPLGQDQVSASSFLPYGPGSVQAGSSSQARRPSQGSSSGESSHGQGVAEQPQKKQRKR